MKVMNLPIPWTWSATAWVAPFVLSSCNLSFDIFGRAFRPNLHGRLHSINLISEKYRNYLSLNTYGDYNKT